MAKVEDETIEITEEDFDEFLSAESCEEQFKILLAHAEKNQKIILKKGVKNERD